jgi:GT2 family glycosyltransferase/glycosyltransferase involved in cell wall biosynthesis
VFRESINQMEGPTTVSWILHGHVWPDDNALRSLHTMLRDIVPGSDILEAHEYRVQPRGAAAAINDAASRARGDVLVVLESGVRPDPGELKAFIHRAKDGLVVQSGKLDNALRCRGAEHQHTGTDPLQALLEALDREPDAVKTAGLQVWAIKTSTFRDSGGLDARLWSIGFVEDLAARLRRMDIAVAEEEAANTTTGFPAWPLVPHLRDLLVVRNRLITAFKVLDADAVGELLTEAAARGLIASWRATGLDTATFRFGGEWGRGRIRGGVLPLSDPEGVLRPLFALDSFLDQVPSLLPDRQRYVTPMESGERSGPLTLTLSPVSGERELPHASVIVVNWNGREHLRACFESLLQSNYPNDRIELTCVDNGSTDGSVDLLRRSFPTVRVVPLPDNRGFTGGNAAGVASSHGDVLVFLNNDMRVEPGTIGALVSALGGTTQCASARVLSWDGRSIDFVRGTLNFEGRGFQDFYGEPTSSDRASAADTFFPNGGACAVTREAYERAGGFDPAFFAYYDDVDLGWRLRLGASSIRVVENATVYHRHGATSRKHPRGQKLFLMERNSLWTMMKNYGDEGLGRTLGLRLLLTVRRLLDDSALSGSELRSLSPFLARLSKRGRPPDASLVYGGRGAGIDRRSAIGDRRSAIDVRRSASGSSVGQLSVRRLPLEVLGAAGAALSEVARVAVQRRGVQSARRADEREVLARFGRTFESASSFSSYQDIQESLVQGLELPRLFNPQPRLLIISHEAIGERMSGPAVRFLEIGRALSAVARVTIAVPGEPLLRDARCTIAGYDSSRPASVRRLAEDADILFVQGFTLSQYPFLTTMMLPIVVDLYCPFTLEHLEQTRARARGQPTAGGSRPEGLPHGDVDEAAGILGVQNTQLDHGDFFICASEVQRDFWLGNLHSRERINPLTYADDPTLRRLIDVVPFGLPDEDVREAARRAGDGTPPGPVLKGARPGIERSDNVLLWAGSMLDWQDPQTLIRAVARLASARSDVKLVFMGTRHPNPLVSPMKVIDESRALAADLGVLDRHVFFNDWVPYEQRARWLLEADLGLSTHRDHLETHFSFRTRMLDYVWARVPIVCTRGDVFAGLVESRGLGLTVPPGDVDALASAVLTMLDDGARRERAIAGLNDLAGEMRWSQVVGPLIEFCRAPRYAADRDRQVRRVRAHLARQFRTTKWLKRTALRFGVAEYHIERVKRWRLVQSAMSVRNRVAMARAQRRQA